MTLSESAINEILAVLNEGGGADLVRQLAQFGIQELIEVEATEAIGAAAWERSPERVTHRNGHRPRTLSTKAGDLELGIPKFRRGAFFPEILEPRRRIDQAMYAVVMEAYVNGVSTRSVDALVAALGGEALRGRLGGVLCLNGVIARLVRTVPLGSQLFDQQRVAAVERVVDQFVGARRNDCCAERREARDEDEAHFHSLSR